MLKAEHYCISKENIAVHEIIGLNAMVVGSTDANKIGLRGKIVDETKNTIVVESGKKEKVLPKKEIVLELSLGNEKVVLNGKKILFRPEERTKKMWRRS